MYDEVHLIAAPPASVQHRYSLDRQAFVAFSKLATLRQFPAGQLRWEISGVPRSCLMKVPPARCRQCCTTWPRVCADSARRSFPT